MAHAGIFERAAPGGCFPRRDWGNVAGMQVCGHRAVLVITQSVQGTSTSVARRRVELSCQLPPGHEGAHQDTRHDEHWDGKPGHMPTLLRHEDEEKSDTGEQ